MRRGPSAWRSFAWRVGWGTPRLEVVRRHVGRVAARLDDAGRARAAADALGLPGLYRSPACWGGDAEPPDDVDSSLVGSRRRALAEWAARCQAASFEIAVAVGARAVPFVIDNAFGPFDVLHGIGLRALFRLDLTTGAVDPEVMEAAVERLGELETPARQEAIDGLIADAAPPARPRIAEGLERLVRRAESVRARLSVLDPLARIDPDRARRFLPDLRRLLSKTGEHALDAALLIRALEPRDTEAKDILRHFAQAHPDPEVRSALETRLRPPHPVPGGSA